MAPGSSTGAQPGPDSRKRKADTPASNGRREKRSVVHSARSIPAQPAEAALKDGELDLQAFVAAHEFEIRALEQSMATSKAVASSRAFQKVPRGLRRRTASHNPKRVPRRLRKRALKEMKDDNTPVVEARRRKPRTTRAKIRSETARKLGILAARKRKASLAMAKAKQDGDASKDKALAVIGRPPRPKLRRNELNEPPKPKSKFRKRQLNKTWLPTHSWHAKRARMTDPLEPLWRFAIPLTPNEKIYRPTHRAQGDRGAVVWEMSYMSTIGLYGKHAGIERVLKRIGVVQDSCWNDKGKKWRIGTRSWTGVLSREIQSGQQNQVDRKMIGPCTILWNPEPSAQEDSQELKQESRQVFLRIHPSAFLELFNELLSLIKQENPRLYIEDLRFEIGSLDLTGPGSTEALLGILRTYPVKDKTKTNHTEIFQGLAGLTNAATLPAGAVLGFSVQDPRLQYPPRRREVPEDPESQLQLLEKIASWSAEENLNPYAIFDRDTRHAASCFPSQKQIDRRRAKNAPGTSLKLTADDPPIPVILLASRTDRGTQKQGTWTLLAPWKCIQHLWYSLVHYPLSSGGNPRFAGLNEIRQVAFERGQTWFPGDFPGTKAGAAWELEERRKRRAAWEKRPKSKRTAWESLDLGGGRKGEIGDGFASDFELLFNAGDSQTSEENNTEGAMDVSQDENSASTQVPKQQEPRIYQLRQISKDVFNQAVTSPSTPSTIPINALLGVRISLISRGVVTPCARIYRLPSRPTTDPQSSEAEVPATIPPGSLSTPSSLPYDLRSQWLSQARPSLSTKNKACRTSTPRDLESLKRQLAAELVSKPAPYPFTPANKSDMNGHPLVPNVEDLVGFVTTGSFSLTEGHGMAIGSIAIDKVLDDVKENAKEGRYCIVRNAGESVGWLAKWEAV